LIRKGRPLIAAGAPDHGPETVIASYFLESGDFPSGVKKLY